MKEFEQQIQDQKNDRVEIVDQKQQKKELRFVGSQRKVRGHTLWEFNYSTRVLKPATFKKQDYTLTSLDPEAANLKISSKVHIEESCEYFQALNRKNAIRHLAKMGFTVKEINA